MSTSSLGRVVRTDEDVTYTYDGRRYAIDVLLPTYVSVAACVVCALLFWAGVLRLLTGALFVVAVYSMFNAWAAHAYPRRVTLGKYYVAFESFGHVDEYPLPAIRRLAVRESQGMRAYVRINGGGLTGNRFFLPCSDLYDEDGNDASDLYRFLLDTEARLDPEGLRVRSRERWAKEDGR